MFTYQTFEGRKIGIYVLFFKIRDKIIVYFIYRNFYVCGGNTGHVRLEGTRPYFNPSQQ